MTKLRIIFLLVFLALFLCGCVQTWPNVPISPAENSVEARKSNRSSSESAPSEKEKKIDQKFSLKAPSPPVSPEVKAPSPHPYTPPSSGQPGSSAAGLSRETGKRPLPPKRAAEPVPSAPPDDPEEDTETAEADEPKTPENTSRKGTSAKKIQSLLDEALDFCQASQDFWQKGEHENALEALDQAYSLILKVESLQLPPDLAQQKEDLRFTISKRILEIYASRNIVVNGNHRAIPMEMNKHIQAEIDLLATGKEKNFFLESYIRSERYRPQIVSALKNAGLPVELSWLPLIESGFKVNALSRSRALGLWQFIPSTGYKFGLKRDIYIDERLDPEKSTLAAIAYLKELHQLFGDWTTVLAAYNCGEGRVFSLIRDQNVNYLDNFWDLYERLPRETARYVPRFLATLHILNSKDKYGLDAIQPDSPLDYETVTVSKQVHLKDIAKALDMPEQAINELNPELRYKILPLEGYPLKVPPGKGQVLLAKLDEIPVASKPARAYVTPRVRPGETLSSIASRYRTSLTQIARANNISKSNYIIAGQHLKIPQKETTKHPSEKVRPPARKQAVAHVVKSGDSLWILAKRYGTTTAIIQEYNKLPNSNLHIGQTLMIPGLNEESPPTEELKTSYLVKQGDTPFNIAQLHKMPLERFLRINHLTPRSKIYPGQKLFVE